MTSSALGITTHYVSDGQLPLTISSDESTATVLYGLGPAAEKTDTWNFVLNDGTGIPRQLTDMAGVVTLSTRYNPWGKPIEIDGTGNFDASFIGTLIDATTGLIYIGNGQYYDPETGRFLTRGVNPNSTNPYVPWNPSGGILVPIGLASVYYSRRKKRSKAMDRLVLFVFALLMMMNLACCTPSTTPEPTTAPDTTASTQGTAESGTAPAQTQTPAPSPDQTPATTATTSQCGSYCAAWLGGKGEYKRGDAVEFARKNKVSYLNPDIHPYLGTDCTNFVSYALRAGGLLTNNTWEPGSLAWVNTPEFFNYLQGVGFTVSIEFINSQDASTSDNFDFLQLRDNNTQTATEKQVVEKLWSKYMNEIQNARPGDLVFYEDSNRDGWDHVGIITEGWTAPTHKVNTQVYDSEPNEPQIIDHSGPTTDLPRSIGDSNTDIDVEGEDVKDIYRVQVLFGP